MPRSLHLYHTRYSKNQDIFNPQFRVQGTKIYKTSYNLEEGNDLLPWYEIRGNRVFATAHSPYGHSFLPYYEIRSDKIFQTRNHPDGASRFPAYILK
jgi:hypothetical protein